jgi:uncharacterized protein (TIGR02284 family)
MKTGTSLALIIKNMVMVTTDKLIIEILNDLIKINNDRIEEYERASEEAKTVDIDLQGIFKKLAGESIRHVKELTQEVKRLDGAPVQGSTHFGKIYRVWTNVKTTFSGKDRHAMLESFEREEEATQKSYSKALAFDDMNEDTRHLVEKQQAAMEIGHSLIKKYRDINKAS